MCEYIPHARPGCRLPTRPGRRGGNHRAAKAGFGRPAKVRSKKPGNSINSTRPAKDSDACLIKFGEALPRIRKRAGFSGRSTKTRNTANNSGINWILSKTTGPSSWPSTSSGFCSRLRFGWDSRSNLVDFCPTANCLANVVFPAWRGPSRAVTGDRRTASFSLLDNVRARKCWYLTLNSRIGIPNIQG